MKEDTERTPLRTILTNFLNHIDTLENQRTPDNTYESEFQELKLFSESIKGTKQYSCSEGEKEVNRKKNRYKDILPFDGTRVVLNDYAGVPGSDYINANYIKGASGSPAYIACQGPLPHTVNDFWRMVVQCEVQVIVMACNEEEAGKHKCENYWVSEEEEEKQLGMVSLRLLKASTVCPDFSVRTMRLKYTNNQENTEERTVCQFHYSAWPDHGVPPLVRPLLDMVRLVRDTQASETLPVLIHCSAGCGRTGTICAIDYVWGLLRAGKLTKDFSLLLLVREMRKQRIAMVQTKEQYVLVHRAVRELFREQLRMIDSHPYENIDCNGLPLIKCPSPQPTYDNISNYQNNKAEEKQDEKEKEQAPPLPKKKRFQTLSSKQAKEVENLSERQRQLERVTVSHSRQVSRSHSLGSVRPHPHPPHQTNTVDGKALPIPGRGILRVPQPQPRPALPVKRSKSLRVLGSNDRGKLSIPPTPPGEADPQRRLSLESNYDEMKDLVVGGSGLHLSDYLSVDSIVAGLGVRERSNSFRRAVENESLISQTAKSKPGQLMRSHTSVDMRSPRDTKLTKPLLSPKPKILLKSADLKQLPSDVKSSIKIATSRQPSAVSKVNQSLSHPTYSKPLSFRGTSKPLREDCLVSRASGTVAQSCSSSESTVSTSSEQGGVSSHITKQAGNVQLMSEKSLEVLNLENKTRQIKPVEGYSNVTPQKRDNHNSAFRLDGASFVSSREQSQLIKRPGVLQPTPPGRSEKSIQSTYQKISLPSDTKKNSVPQNARHLVYDSKGSKQNAGVYVTVNKPSPPPYVEPGKTAQKPRSSPHSLGDKQATPGTAGQFSEVYGKLQEQTHWLAGYSSRDLVLPAHSSPSKPSTSGDRLPVPDVTVGNLSTKHSERRKKEENFTTPRKKSFERGEEQVLPQDLGLNTNEQRYQPHESHVKTERRQFQQDQQRHLTDMGSKLLIDKQTKEQLQLHSLSLYSKSFNDKRPFNRNLHMTSHVRQFKTARREPDLSPQEVTEEYCLSQQETFPKSEDRRLQVPQDILFDVNTSPGHSCVRRGVDQEFLKRPRLPQSQESPHNLTGVSNPSLTPNQGLRVRQCGGSRDDLALCGAGAGGGGVSSRVRRQASAVFSRHSAHPLAVWSQTNSGVNQTPLAAKAQEDGWWVGADVVGVDVDRVAASISTQKDGKMMRAALEALHLRKSSSKPGSASQATPAPPSKPGAFRKQQQYL